MTTRLTHYVTISLNGRTDTVGLVSDGADVAADAAARARKTWGARAESATLTVKAIGGVAVQVSL